MDITLIDGEKPIRSWSQFSTYMRCPQMYKAVYIDKSIPRTKTSPALLGSTVHFAHEKLAEFKKNGRVLDLDEAILFAEGYWDAQEEALDDLINAPVTKAQIIPLVTTYYDYFVKEDIAPKETEKDLLWFPKGYSFGLRGIVDRIDVDDSIIDLKTSKKTPSRSPKSGNHYVDIRSGYRLQLDTYIMLARANGYDPKRAGLEVVVKNKRPKVVPVDYPVNEDFLKSTMDLMAELNENITAGHFPKNRLGNFCSPGYCKNWEACTGIKPEAYEL